MANGAKDDVIRNVAIGATGVALAAGAVATGMALANKTTRQRITRALKEGADTYQAFQHRIRIKKSAHGRRKIKRG